MADSNTLTAEVRLSAILEADSLASLQPNMETKMKIAGKAALLYMKADSADKALQYFYKTLQYADKLPDHEVAGMTMNNIGIILNNRSEYDSALYYYNRADSIFQLKKNNLRIAQGLINMAIVYKNLDVYDTAIEKTYKAMQLLKSEPVSKDLASAYTNIGNILKGVHRYNKAIEYHTKAMNIRIGLGDTAGVGASLNNIGNIHKHNKEYTKALQYYFKALELVKRSNAMTKVTILDNISECYIDLRQYNQAEKLISQIFSYRNTITDADGYATSANNLSRLLLNNSQGEKAEHIALNAKNSLQQYGSVHLKLENIQLLGHIYLQEHDYLKASAYMDTALILKDSLSDANMSSKVLELETRYQTKEKEHALALSAQLHREQQQKIKTQRVYISLFAGAVLMLSVILYLVFRLSRQRRLAKENIEVLMSELNHRVKNNLQVITGILQLQIDNASDRSIQQMLYSSKSRVDAIWVIHELLQSQTNANIINMQDFMSALVNNLSSAYDNNASFDILLQIDNLVFETETAIPLGLIVNELLTNIFKYGTTPESKNISLSLTSTDGKYILTITDNGKQWYTTDLKNQKKGLGLHLVELLAEQLDGNWIITGDSTGTKHTITF